MKSFNFVGIKFRGLTTLRHLRGFEIKCIITKVNKYFVGYLNTWIALTTKNTKLNVQRIKIISQYALLFCFQNSSDCISRKAYYNLFVWLTGKLISRKAYTNLFVWLTGKYNFLFFCLLLQVILMGLQLGRT